MYHDTTSTKSCFYNLSSSVRAKEESCIRVHTRELNRVSSIKCLSYIYLANSLCYTKPGLH